MQSHKVLTEGKVPNPDEVGGEGELPEAVRGGEQVPAGDDDGAAPVEARVLAAHPHCGLPGVRSGSKVEKRSWIYKYILYLSGS